MKVRASFYITVKCPNCGLDVEADIHRAKNELKSKVILCTVDVGPNGDAGCGQQFILNTEISYSLKCAVTKLPQLELKEVDNA